MVVYGSHWGAAAAAGVCRRGHDDGPDAAGGLGCAVEFLALIAGDYHT